jgi:predicted RNA binding protein YcfA (HicA-like mRNA interferase family)
MGERFPQCSPAEVIRAFERLGFVIRQTTGSHVILLHRGHGRMITIPFHSGDLKRGLLFGLLKQAGIDRDAFLKAL